jgi:transcriptional regulator with XRE-family HTH domain
MYALPFCEIELHAQKPMNPAYPKILNSIGDHIRKRRLDLKLKQKELSLRLGVAVDTIVNWEKNYSAIDIHLIPKIIEFLGYIPFNKDYTEFKDKLQYFRKLSGLSQEKLAALLQVDESTIASWERGEHKPIKKLLNKLNEFFSSFQDIL